MFCVDSVDFKSSWDEVIDDRLIDSKGIAD